MNRCFDDNRLVLLSTVYCSDIAAGMPKEKHRFKDFYVLLSVFICIYLWLNHIIQEV
jgi:hypothetical protein